MSHIVALTITHGYRVLGEQDGRGKGREWGRGRRREDIEREGGGGVGRVG